MKTVPAFSPKVVNAMLPIVEATFDEIMRELAGNDEFDFLDRIAFPYPARIIGRLFGVPDSDLTMFGSWSEDVAKLMHAGIEDTDRMLESLLALSDYLRAFLDKGTGSVLVDSLSALSPEDLVATCVLMLFAGHETTKNLLGNSMTVIFDYPDEWRRFLRNQVTSVETVDEILRFEGPAKATVRMVRDDFEFADSQLKKDDKILIAFAGANRDESVFPDPNRPILDRANARSLAFGYGIHYCVGAPLARLETQVALSRLPQYWNTIDGLPTPEERVWQRRLINRGLEELPMSVSWK